MTPLGYMLAVMNDPAADPVLRAQMAASAAPYVHPLARSPVRRTPYDEFLPRAVREHPDRFG